MFNGYNRANSQCFAYSFVSVFKFIYYCIYKQAGVNIHCEMENIGIQFSNQLEEYDHHFPIFPFLFLVLGFIEFVIVCYPNNLGYKFFMARQQQYTCSHHQHQFHKQQQQVTS